MNIKIKQIVNLNIVNELNYGIGLNLFEMEMVENK
jgi:hypothetical protein